MGHVGLPNQESVQGKPSTIFNIHVNLTAYLIQQHSSKAKMAYSKYPFQQKPSEPSVS
jgi:hypothetical protein